MKYKRTKSDSTQKCPYCDKQFNMGIRRIHMFNKGRHELTCSKCKEKFIIVTRTKESITGKIKIEFYGMTHEDYENYKARD